MRELTDEAAAIAGGLGGTTALRDHGGGFSPATVQLHRISSEFSTGDPLAALAAARALPPQSLPSVERRAGTTPTSPPPWHNADAKTHAYELFWPPRTRHPKRPTPAPQSGP
ncbi:hypothetical protein SAMN05216223_11676 [Actinacidiphila yanglinensis]|uniref:Uncharacterized protein n=1 Tax=Actinacidiphila yanglinensis TaxID=310779 RepID=A0A1H6DJS4_9ACTN|nr:hypothetical protein [Actinacidiphila yanglinensis]SEG85488.1 hypothetical protein SAMN05216223_11676 [Actinacidiphila yanglinensis]